MELINRMLLESRYIISLNKQIKDLVPIIKVSEDVIYDDINNHLEKFDKELYNRVINILNKKY